MDELRAAPPESLTRVLATAAGDPHEPLVRSTAAFTLGVLGGDAAREQLAGMLTDTWPDARFNAATALARSGDLRALDVVLVMLDPEEMQGVEIEQELASRDFKRHMILANGLRAAESLGNQNRGPELQPLVDAVDALLAERLPPDLRLLAANVSRTLKVRASRAEVDR